MVTGGSDISGRDTPGTAGRVAALRAAISPGDEADAGPLTADSDRYRE